MDNTPKREPKSGHKGMKNSSPTNAQSSDDGAARDQEPPATKNAARLTNDVERASGGGARAGATKVKEVPFTFVTHTKRKAAPVAQKGAQANDADPSLAHHFPELAPTETEESRAARPRKPTRQIRDPFGLGRMSTNINPVTIEPPRRVTIARTKQSVRQKTAGSSGSSSERSRSRIWAKGCHQDKARNRASVTSATKTKRAKDAPASDLPQPKEKDSKKPKKAKASPPSDTSSEGWNTDGSESGGGLVNDPKKSPKDTNVKAPVLLPTTGRFNGRIHATPVNGSCGPAALLEAIRHLARSRGIQFVLPENADALRAQMVQHISENLDDAGAGGTLTLEQEIEAEYFPGDVPLAERTRGLFNPDIDTERYVLVNTVEGYLALMSEPNTHMDEFMLSAFARMWEVRVAVMRRDGDTTTTEHSQFVPTEAVPAEFTIFLYRSGHHFEWAHANCTPCGSEHCKKRGKRVSAAHTPWHLPIDGKCNPTQTAPPPVARAAEGARPSRGGDGDLAVLIEQLQEEYPGLSPDRAEAALRLTKQQGRFNVYRAAAVLPGREGARIVLPSESPPLSRDNPGVQDAEGKVHFSSSSGESESTSDSDAASGCKGGAHRKQQPESSDDDEQVLANKSGSDKREGGAGLNPTSKAGGTKATQPHCGNCGQHQHSEKEGELSSQDAKGWQAYHIARCRELKEMSQRNAAAKAAAEEHRAIGMAAQVISIAAKTSLKEAHDMLIKHIMLHGELNAATQSACQELMDGPRKARPAAKVNDVPDSGGVGLAERQFGRGARTPTVRLLAKRAKQEETLADSEDAGGSESDERQGSPPRPKRLFDRAFSEQMRAVSGNLTAGQRLSTAVRRADGALWRQARDERFANQEENGETPASAALLGNDTMRTTAAQAATKPPTALRAAANHASPGVRIAEQMRMKREQIANAQNGQGAVVVVNSTGGKLPVWRPGSEADGRGFNWKTKQKMLHAWEQYQLSEGLHAPKTFKSMIDPDLIPLICAECELEEGDWEVLDDVALLSAIEEKLRPHDAMDFTVQLKHITFDNDESKGTLTQRYRLFAEAFLAKVSEAKAAGCALQENVVKLAFSRAVSGNAILQGWLEQNKWVSAGETHRRITTSLKMVDAYQALAGMGHARQQQGQQQGQQNAAPAQQQQAPPAQQHHVQQPQYQPRQAARQSQNFNQQVGAAVNAALAAYQQGALQQQQAMAATPPQQQAAGGGHQQHENGGAAVNAMSTQTQMALPPFPGIDLGGRGISWHVHGPLLQCRCIPCTSKFCQACGVHGHTVENCRKRLFKNPGINTSGYWSEQKPTSGPLLMPAPAPMQFSPAPGAQQAPAFPTPYRLAAGGGSSNHLQAQQAPAPSGGSAQGAAVNNAAARGSRVTFQEQPSPDGSNGSKEGGNQ